MGLGIAYVIVKKLAKKEIKQRILNEDLGSISELLTIKLDDPKFSLIEENEFLYEGKLYDILSMQINGGFRCIKCVRDDKENSSINSISSLVKSVLNDESGSLSLKLKKVISNLLEFATLSTEYKPIITYWAPINNFEKATKILSIFLTIPNPPPEFNL